MFLFCLLATVFKGLLDLRAEVTFRTRFEVIFFIGLDGLFLVGILDIILLPFAYKGFRRPRIPRPWTSASLTSVSS